jgi:hypothetical protein
MDQENPWNWLRRRQLTDATRGCGLGERFDTPTARQLTVVRRWVGTSAHDQATSSYSPLVARLAATRVRTALAASAWQIRQILAARN